MRKNCCGIHPADKQKLGRAKHALLCMQRHSWEHGVAMQAFLEAGEKETVILLAKEAVYRMSADGRPALLDYVHAVTDPISVGEALMAAWKWTGDQELETCLEKLKRWMFQKAPRDESGLLYHVDDEPQFWVDSMYMLPATMAALGNPKEGDRQMEGYWNKLYDPHRGLMKHIWNEEKQRYDRNQYWGVGNGWALSGIARLIDLLPEELEEERQKWIIREMQLLQEVLRWRCAGGFHDILDDPESFVEVNLAQMTAYTIYRGVLSGWLPAKDWLETAEALRVLSESKLDDYGIIREVCGAPDFDKPGTAPEAQAFYIMMEVAAEKLRLLDSEGETYETGN